MKFGIDAKWYFEGPPSGKRVVRSLVDHMLDMDEKNEYVIFLDKKHRREKFPYADRKNVTLCYVWAGNNFLSNIFIVPLFSNLHKLDAVLYQNFISPLDRAKRIAYIHDVLFLSNPEYYTVFERLYFSPLRFLTKLSDKIVTVSEEEKKRLIAFEFCKDPDKIVVAHHGVDTNFAPREDQAPQHLERVRVQYQLPHEFLLFVGRLNLRKNVDNLLRAIPLLGDKKIPLVIVGADNWKKSNHTQIISKLGIESRIIFTGAIYKDLAEVYALAKLFCFPSYAESFGLPPLEAMASGVPVVVSNTTSLPEVCGAAGYYVTPDKPSEIAQAIDHLLSDQKLHAEKKELGLQQAKLFTWQRAAETVIQCMAQLTADK